MAKVTIINPSDGTRVPFLRGILTRSLCDSGLSFDDAYRTSTAIRNELDNVESLANEDLRIRVAEHLELNFGKDIRHAYEESGLESTTVQVRGRDGQALPFSRPQHLNCLESCGLNEEQANSATTQVLHQLRETEVREIGSRELGRLTYQNLGERFGRKVAHRYMVWIDHQHSGRPLIVFLGGSTGCGKSTIATELAHRLGIVRTQSTDMLREVMRMMIPERLLPVLHASSFNAGEALPGSYDDASEEQIAGGYLTQSELLSVPCEAVVQRALRERVSLILEGVHVHPDLLERIGEAEGAVVVMVMLAVLKRDQLHKRLAGRLTEAPDRAGSGHLELFDRIWQLQSFLLSEADRCSVPILVNDNRDRAINRVMTTLIDTLAEDFDKTPEQVFGTPEKS